MLNNHSTTSIFIDLYEVTSLYISFLDNDHYNYIGNWIELLWMKLRFTDEEVEQAYLKKHEENYRRQREGY